MSKVVDEGKAARRSGGGVLSKAVAGGKAARRSGGGARGGRLYRSKAAGLHDVDVDGVGAGEAVRPGAVEIGC